MAKVLVSGLINVETTLAVDGFPIDYSPVRYPFFGVRSTVSGVGYNVAKALATLGSKVRLLSVTGQDPLARLVRQSLAQAGVGADLLVDGLSETPQSVILYDEQGRRQINVDLKDVQEQVYPLDLFDRVVDWCDVAVLTNVNFARPLLHRAQNAGVPIATDVHTLADLEDAYNAEFMAAADILFMSDELLPLPPEAWAKAVLERYRPKVLVIGLGSQGALLAVEGEGVAVRLPAVHTRPVVNTVGGGDALFSAFVHFYYASRDPHDALQKAMVFASYKVGATGAAEGFLDEPGVLAWLE